MNDKQKFSALLSAMRRENTHKECFICLPKQCKNPTISAHSISRSKHLGLISENGMVYTPDFNPLGGFVGLKGKKAASTFPGMCGTHDKIYQIIDEQDYTVGNEEFEFLCAFRAVAKEWHSKLSQYNGAIAMQNGAQVNNPFIELYKYSVGLGVQDNERDRRYLNHLYLKGRFNRIHTVPIIFDKMTPIAVSSMFALQVDFDGKTVNDLGDTQKHPTSLFFTIFPEEERTIVLLSCRTSEKEKLESIFSHIISSHEDIQKMIISNVIAGYVENFAISPSYWSNLSDEMQSLFKQVFTQNIAREVVPLISDEKLNIFQ